jgi:hypothetical protein
MRYGLQSDVPRLRSRTAGLQWQVKLARIAFTLRMHDPNQPRAEWVGGASVSAPASI